MPVYLSGRNQTYAALLARNYPFSILQLFTDDYKSTH